MIKKILLIFPHLISLKGYYKNLMPPLGLAYLGAVLEKNGFEVNILDIPAEGYNHEEKIEDNYIKYGIPLSEIKKRINDFSPDLIGISALISNQWPEVLELVTFIKKLNKQIKIILGGNHVSAKPEEILKNKNIDFIILGESEDTIIELINSINNNSDLSKLDGIGFKNNGKIIIIPKTKFIQNLDKIPFPARHLLPMSMYFKINKPQGMTFKKIPNTTLLTSRGCPMRCVFCSSTKNWGNNYRTRSPENVINEIEHLVKTWGVKEIHILDDNLTFNRERALKLFKLIKSKNFGVLFSVPSGLFVNSLDFELLDAMKDCGFYDVTLAIESGDQYVLNNIIKKPVNLNKVKGIVDHCRKIKMQVRAFFVIGFPQETLEQIKKTIDFAYSLDFDSVSIHIATPLPGTELYDYCISNGLIKDQKRFDFSKTIIQTKNFDSRLLNKIASRSFLMYHIKLLFLHPIRFFKKFGTVLLFQPKIVFNFFISKLKTMVKK